MGDHPHAGAPHRPTPALRARLSDPADGGVRAAGYQPMFAGAGARRRAYARAHPIVSLAPTDRPGIITLFLVSLVVFRCYPLLPGNAARAILGFSATPQRIRASSWSWPQSRLVGPSTGVALGLPVGRLGRVSPTASRCGGSSSRGC